jgi:protein KTI12
MPLVILSGLPSSGKTRRAQELKALFETRLASQPQDESSSKSKDYRIHIVNDESLGLDKHQCYNTAANEKKARGALMSAVERLLSKDDIVIVDSLNYIKGFRYQLYCLARAISTPHCVVSVSPNEERESPWILFLLELLDKRG